jgi:hypothetical protein
VLLNELLQWSVLVFLLVVVIGLARQLGVFMLPHHAQLAEQGPELGDRLNRQFVPPADQERLVDLIADQEARCGIVVVLDEACGGCAALVEDLSHSTRSVPLLAVAKESGPEFVERLRKVADIVVDDREGEGVRAAGIVATPYGVKVGSDARVTEVAAASDLQFLLEGSVHEGPALVYAGAARATNGAVLKVGV